MIEVVFALTLGVLFAAALCWPTEKQRRMNEQCGCGHRRAVHYHDDGGCAASWSSGAVNASGVEVGWVPCRCGLFRRDTSRDRLKLF